MRQRSIPIPMLGAELAVVLGSELLGDGAAGRVEGAQVDAGVLRHAAHGHVPFLTKLLTDEVAVAKRNCPSPMKAWVRTPANAVSEVVCHGMSIAGSDQCRRRSVSCKAQQQSTILTASRILLSSS